MKTLPLLPPLLFRQKLLLAALAGSVSLRDVMLGVAFFLLLVVVSHRERPLRYLLLGAAFLLGFGLTFSAHSEPPACPSWAAVPGKSVGVEGRVASVTGLPGGRVRVLMEGLRPWKSLPPMSGETENAVRQALERRVDMPRPGRKNYPGEVVKDETSPLPDLVAMTLDAATLSHTGRPVQGQTLRALLRLYPVSGSLNPGTGDIAVYWADRDVRHRARLDRKSGVPVFLEWQEGEGWLCRAALIREEWRAALVRALAGNLPEDAATPEYQTARQGALLFSQGKAMLVALLFGDRSFLDPETVDIFTRAGLVHSLALSGQHLSLAAMADMKRAGRIGGDELDHDFLAGSTVTIAVFFFLFQYGADDALLGRRRQSQIDETGKPFVLVNATADKLKVCSVNFDNFQGAALATQELIDHGHRNIAFIQGKTQYVNAPERYQGYRQTLEKNDLPFRPDFLYEGDYSIESGYQAASSIINNNEVTAVLSSSDMMLFGIIKWANEHQVNAFNRFSMIGFDNDPYDLITQYPLTTIDQQISKMVSKSVGALLKMIINKNITHQKLIVTPELIRRQSVRMIKN